MLLTKTQLHARALRNNATDAERKLWQLVRAEQLGVKFRRQHPIPPYVVDFVCLEQKVIVELDGGQHAERQAYDAERSRCLHSLGFQVLRFWNNEVFDNLDDVMASIHAALHPTLTLPAGGEGMKDGALI